MRGATALDSPDWSASWFDIEESKFLLFWSAWKLGFNRRLYPSGGGTSDIRSDEKRFSMRSD